MLLVRRATDPRTSEIFDVSVVGGAGLEPATPAW
jgi:hypothetical protein